MARRDVPNATGTGGECLVAGHPPTDPEAFPPDPEEERVQVILDTVGKVVHRYRALANAARSAPTGQGANGGGGPSGLNRWRTANVHFDTAELRQAAFVEVLQAVEESYDPLFETPFAAFCWGVAVSAVKNALIRSRSPVSCSSRSEKLKWIDQTEKFETIVDERTDSPYDHAVAKERSEMIRERLRDLVGDRGIDFVLGVFTGEHTPREIAEAHGCTAKSVSNLREKARQRIVQDEKLRKLWEE